MGNQLNRENELAQRAVDQIVQELRSQHGTYNSKDGPRSWDFGNEWDNAHWTAQAALERRWQQIVLDAIRTAADERVAQYQYQIVAGRD